MASRSSRRVSPPARATTRWPTRSARTGSLPRAPGVAMTDSPATRNANAIGCRMRSTSLSRGRPPSGIGLAIGLMVAVELETLLAPGLLLLVGEHRVGLGLPADG